MIISLHERRRARIARLPVDWPARAAMTALIALASVQGVRLALAALTPVSPLGDWRLAGPPELDDATRAGLFARVDPFFRTQPVAAQPTSRVTGLPLQLFGTRVDRSSGGGSAIIAGQDQIQKSILVGEEIQSGVKLVAVHFDHVEIDNAGARELLYIDQSDAPQPPAGAQGALPSTPPGVVVVPGSLPGAVTPPSQSAPTAPPPPAPPAPVRNTVITPPPQVAPPPPPPPPAGISR